MQAQSSHTLLSPVSVGQKFSLTRTVASKPSRDKELAVDPIWKTISRVWKRRRLVKRTTYVYVVHVPGILHIKKRSWQIIFPQPKVLCSDLCPFTNLSTQAGPLSDPIYAWIWNPAHIIQRSIPASFYYYKLLQLPEPLNIWIAHAAVHRHKALRGFGADTPQFTGPGAEKGAVHPDALHADGDAVLPGYHVLYWMGADAVSFQFCGCYWWWWCCWLRSTVPWEVVDGLLDFSFNGLYLIIW